MAEIRIQMAPERKGTFSEASISTMPNTTVPTQGPTPGPRSCSSMVGACRTPHPVHRYRPVHDSTSR